LSHQNVVIYSSQIDAYMKGRHLAWRGSRGLLGDTHKCPALFNARLNVNKDVQKSHSLYHINFSVLHALYSYNLMMYKANTYTKLDEDDGTINSLYELGRCSPRTRTFVHKM